MEGDIKGFRKKVIVYQISIHALRVEGDGNAEDKRVAQLLISIHALRVEGDCTHLRWMPRNARFLSTPSGWRATLVPRADRRRRGHFYPRPPGGGRHSILITTPRWKRNFYPRPPGGGRLSTSTPIWRSLYFYPRPPGGGRLAGGEFPNLPAGISIHALRVEGDRRSRQTFPRCQDFYPRPPGGGRRVPFRPRPGRTDFYPRPPGGGRRIVNSLMWTDVQISIHALRVEGDRIVDTLFIICPVDFYPRPPGGGRLFSVIVGRFDRFNFYPRPPGGGRRIHRI